MVELHEKYHNSGLEVFAFPCNQFFKEESGTEDSIKNFARTKYGVKFWMFGKVEVNGPNTSDLYRYLRFNSELFNPQSGEVKVVPWNFAKFVLDRNGKVIKFAGPRVKPKEL